jgi:hypothetical protein
VADRRNPTRWGMPYFRCGLKYKMIKLNLLKPKAVFKLDGHAIIRAEHDFLRTLILDDSPPYGEWIHSVSLEKLPESGRPIGHLIELLYD